MRKVIFASVYNNNICSDQMFSSTYIKALKFKLDSNLFYHPSNAE